MPPLLQIVPELPPRSGGVGDFALALARGLRAEYAVKTAFLLANPNRHASPQVEAFPVVQLSHSTDAALVALLRRLAEVHRPGALLLHCSGYGYAADGAPMFLAEALRRFRDSNPDVRTIAWFHELYAFGPPWKRAFWTTLRQRRMVAAVADVAHSLFTNTELHAQRLRRVTAAEINVLPVFSNVGEPEQVIPAGAREKRMVVFGSLGRRRDAYQRYGRDIERACRALQIEEVVDVGPGAASAPERFGVVPVRRCGELSVPEISRLLSTSLAGFVAYPAAYVEKSGIFAAYCAHGMVSIVGGAAGDRAPTSIAGTYADAQQLDAIDPAQVAAEARRWYCQHTRRAHVQQIHCCVLAQRGFSSPPAFRGAL